MKKKKIIVIALMALFVLTLAGYFIERFSYSNELTHYSLNSTKDSVLTIGIIGDSWVSAKKLDSILNKNLLENGVVNKILSSGHPGATSKLIYQNLFKDGKKEHSSKFVIENRPDYCVVIAGVNDAASQIGGNYYSYHMTQIVKTLLHYNIKPIIVSCPEFGIKETIDDMNIFSKNRNVISAYFNNNGEINNIKTYRKTLAKKLISENLQDRVIVVDFDTICSDYSKCLEFYANPSHLSIKGNEKLSQIIAGSLISEIL